MNIEHPCERKNPWLCHNHYLEHHHEVSEMVTIMIKFVLKNMDFTCVNKDVHHDDVSFCCFDFSAIQNQRVVEVDEKIK